MNWQEIVIEIMKEYGPKLVDWTVDYHNQNQMWPTTQEIEDKIESLAGEIELRGTTFLLDKD